MTGVPIGTFLPNLRLLMNDYLADLEAESIQITRDAVTLSNRPATIDQEDWVVSFLWTTRIARLCARV